MKRCFKVMLVIFFISTFPVKALGSVSDINLQEKLDSLYKSVPESVRSYVGAEDGNLTIDKLDSILELKNILSFIASSLYDGLISAKKEYGVLVILSVGVFLVEILFKSSKQSMAKIMNVAVFSFFGLYIFEIVNNLLFGFAENYLMISGITSAVSVVSSAAMLSMTSGNSAAVLGTYCSVLISVFNFVCNSFAVPFINTYLALDLSGSISGNIRITRISRTLRNFSVILISVFLALFTGLMSVQRIISMNGDSLLKKSLKGMLSSGLPILGGAVSDGLDVLFTAVNGIKNSAGLLGVVSSMVLSLSPIIELFLFFIVLSLISFMFSFLEGDSVSSFFNSVRDVVSVLICICVSMSIMTVLLFYFIIRVE